jgi:hypothetical protein
MPTKERYRAEKAAKSRAKRSPKRKPVCVQLADSTRALQAARTMRKCLGRGALDRPHEFLSTDPGNRVCPACRNRRDSLALSPTMLEPMRCTDS